MENKLYEDIKKALKDIEYDPKDAYLGGALMLNSFYKKHTLQRLKYMVRDGLIASVEECIGMLRKEITESVAKEKLKYKKT